MARSFSVRFAALPERSTTPLLTEATLTSSILASVFSDASTRSLTSESLLHRTLLQPRLIFDSHRSTGVACLAIRGSSPDSGQHVDTEAEHVTEEPQRCRAAGGRGSRVPGRGCRAEGGIRPRDKGAE